jgi:sugar phosphate isomerase/epimerase
MSLNRTQHKDLMLDRRHFLTASATTIAAGIVCGASNSLSEAATITNQATFRFGLVTYQWGKDMDLPSVISACQQANMGGVELRTEHKHAVEPNLDSKARSEVRKSFEGSGVTLIGYGSNCEFHSKDPEAVKKNIEQCKKYIQLMHDCGGSGVKVKPNGFVTGVPHEKTIEQIGKALNEVAAYGAQYGQQIRLEVHGKETCYLSNVRAIMAVADHKNAAVCWNSNKDDLLAPGLKENFEMVRDRLGATTHVRKLDDGDYPYDQLFELLLKARYQGWVLLEAHSDPENKIASMKQQSEVFGKLLQDAKSKVGV